MDLSRTWAKQQQWLHHLGSGIRGVGVTVLVICLIVSVEVSKDTSWQKDHLASSDLDVRKPLESLLLFSACIGMFPFVALIFWRIKWGKSLFVTLGLGLASAWMMLPRLPVIDSPHFDNTHHSAEAVTMCLTIGAVLLSLGTLIRIWRGDDPDDD